MNGNSRPLDATPPPTTHGLFGAIDFDDALIAKTMAQHRSEPDATSRTLRIDCISGYPGERLMSLGGPG